VFALGAAPLVLLSTEGEARPLVEMSGAAADARPPCTAPVLSSLLPLPLLLLLLLQSAERRKLP